MLWAPRSSCNNAIVPIMTIKDFWCNSQEQARGEKSSKNIYDRKEMPKKERRHTHT